ncbi:MAG: 3-dehydroquinate synthase, partial [Spirochaetota bacterium]
SVGGKTGIDFGGRKNLIGSFAAPRTVLMDVAFLDSLSEAEFASGMGEVIKHAIIAGGERFDFLESIAGRRPLASVADGRDVLERIVADSVEVKAGVVARDPLEAGERRVLNQGHTFGHALESVLGLAHGHAVAAGLATAARLSVSLGQLESPTLTRILTLLRRFGLPASVGEAARVAGIVDSAELRELVAKALVADKKRVEGEVFFALPRGIGRVDIVGLGLASLEAFIREAA